MSLRPGLGATYRVQLRPDFGFADCAAIIPYLGRLGIETLYLSPVAEAVPGSLHGYDGTDPTHLRAELGGEPGYDALVAACERHGLGICVDHVPNHLSTWPGGRWWREVLAGGPGSAAARIFDIDWDAGAGRVDLPLLDGPLTDAIADGTVRPGSRDGTPVVLVRDVDLPLAPGSEGSWPPGGERGWAPDALAAVLDAQHYRLTDWHDRRQRNYRRFFDIDGLIGVRVEDPEVFAVCHELVIGLARSGRLSAVRVDHVDGLLRPTEYLERLAAETAVPIVVEKILTGDERLRSDWPVAGTTGYETIDDLGGVLVDPHGYDRLARAGRREGDPPVGPLTVQMRRLVAQESFPAEIERAASRLGVDTTRLRDVLTCLPRYRTYLDAGEQAPGRHERPATALWHELDETAVWRSLRPRGVEPTDGEGSDAAVDAAVDAEVDAVVDAVIDAVIEPAHRDVALRVQQLTAALMAKGVEDTAWYRLAGPLAFCEVGGDPARSRHDALERWHDRATERVARHACGLVPGTTHDTKHAQDVRSRLYALSEMAVPFEEGLTALRAAIDLGGAGGELACETRVAAQLALGVVPPLDEEPPQEAGGGAGWSGQDVSARLGAALVKGAREAKRRSSWVAPDEGYEAQLRMLAETLLADRASLLRRSFGPVLVEAIRLGALDSLSSVVLRHALPGVPDCYQGDEVWNLSLVDPDNRRPVDFERMARALELLDRNGAEPAELRRSWRDGRIKLHVTASCLRARHGPGAAAFSPDAAYLRLAASGPASGSVLAFARRAVSAAGIASWAVAVVTRLGARLDALGDDLPAGASYEGTVIRLPEGVPRFLSDAIAGRRVAVHDDAVDVAEVLAILPVALLVAGPGDPQ